MTISANDLERFNSVVTRFEKLQFGMRSTLTAEETAQLDSMTSKVFLFTILDHLAAMTYEAADSCDGEARDWLVQEASVVSAAALFCKTWEPNK